MIFLKSGLKIMSFVYGVCLYLNGQNRGEFIFGKICYCIDLEKIV